MNLKESDAAKKRKPDKLDRALQVQELQKDINLVFS